MLIFVNSKRSIVNCPTTNKNNKTNNAIRFPPTQCVIEPSPIINPVTAVPEEQFPSQVYPFLP